METTVDEISKKLILKIDNTFDKMVHAITRFEEGQYNTVPFEGSWTAGQVVQHIIMSVAELPDKKTQAPQRSYDEKIDSIEKLFLDFGIKMESPEFIIPEYQTYDKTGQIMELKNIQHRHVETIRDTDLSALCVDFEFPTFGYLTRFEWFSFFVFHTQRHTVQVNNIYQYLSKQGL
ncbi:hypothetical protein GCM10009122_05130 [Fulvivirga kasyanovii]|uniref:DinB family protein n=1 Tax=Fulvivirga kasyanovii TaxID=396812 RepID=A0ABW9RPC0_9BACT|nr:DinB family protein [Fulvivirga kasyanovii]MTI25843.1 DinB family protein [Fulvivirga kasyanovii]